MEGVDIILVRKSHILPRAYRHPHEVAKPVTSQIRSARGYRELNVKLQYGSNIGFNEDFHCV